MSHEPADGVRSQPAKTQRATLMAEFRSKSWTTDALALIGMPDTGLYDGSWSEWGQNGIGTEVATG